MITRRQLLIASTSTMALPLIARADASASIASALTSSNLVYITPLKSNGEESRCQSEVWFVEDAGHVLVVTPPESWRARAAQRGLSARLWVGDFGNWKRSNGRYRDAPSFDATAVVVTDPAGHASALAKFGEKYTNEWGTWGPRFEKGLAEGSRVLVNYAPA